jgi:hypothetical protein
MQTVDAQLAVGAAMSSASALGLRVDDAAVLHNTNRLAVRLLPCAVLARVAPVAYQADAAFELEVARRLAETDSPVAGLDPRVEPRVYVRDGFAVTLWTYYEPVSPPEVAPAEYAQALERLHAGLREIDLASPHFMDRVAGAQRLVGDCAHTPELGEADRELLSHSLRELRFAIGQRGAAEQLLHGEPHLGNVLRTKHGLLFIDLGTCCRGPIEFDIAHCALAAFGGSGGWYLHPDMPKEVGKHYPDVDQELVRSCWVLMLAMVAAWRWARGDEFPDGRGMGIELLSQIRAALDR